jgi:SAM-dependent methyltransferase
MAVQLKEGAATLDQRRLDAFVHQALGDMASIASGALTLIGHRLGLYRAMAGAGPMTAKVLAERTHTHERYVREWLNAQAAGGYVRYDPASDRYDLPAEHAMVLANEDSPVFMPGGFDVMAAMWSATERLADAFVTGSGIAWHEHDARLFGGTELFFRPGYRQNLVTSWIPALTGVEAKLKRGARVADIGSGHGASTIIMAVAYPKSQFVGFDYHEASIRVAEERARAANVSDRVEFARAKARDFPGKDYDLICFFDSFHDLGDPVGAARHAAQALAKDGTLMLVEPHAGNRIEENLNTLGRLFYSASTIFCTPNSLSQDIGAALGAQAGEERLTRVLGMAGFKHVRRATETPFNLVIEARR